MKFTKLFKLAAISIAMASLGAVSASHAGTATGTLLVSATVLSTCNVTTTTIAFGNYSSVQLDATGSVTVTCSPGIGSYTVGLGSGIGGASTSTRKLTFSANTLNYSLSQDSAHTQNWGEVQNIDTVSSSVGILSGAAKIFTVFGRLPAGQFSAAGAYGDSVVVTVNF